jgi:glucosylceramidase
MMFFASPWSPPAFMKNTNNMLKGGKLLPEFFQPWANYYTKFIKAYEAEGIPVWGITVQNEPMATQTWESCIYTAEEERDFLKNFLGPTMVREGLGDKKIVVWDHNRDLINQRANVILSDPEAAKYAWGVGFHWYETWTGGQPMFENVASVKKSFPDKNLLFTEGCLEKFDASRYQYWPNAERYGKSLINDFNAGTSGWTDWNILLDETGGPNHVQNLCFAPVHADAKTGELIFTPSFYYLGHFSKFIQPGAKMIATSSSRSQLLSTSFINKDGKIATVVMNQGDTAVTYSIYAGTGAAQIFIPAHAIQTLVY